jgi:hypothetical protein
MVHSRQVAVSISPLAAKLRGCDLVPSALMTYDRITMLDRANNAPEENRPRPSVRNLLRCHGRRSTTLWVHLPASPVDALFQGEAVPTSI